MIEALDELILITIDSKGHIKKPELKNRTQCLEHILSQHLKQIMKGALNKVQLDFCKTPNEVFRLFVMFSKALREIKGYGLDDKNYVFGPEDSEK